MTAPLCRCGCGRPIIQGQWGAEGDEAFAERLTKGYARRKCERLHKPSPSPKDRPTLVADPTAWNLERPEVRAVEKEKPVRDTARVTFARSMPCLLCQSVEGVHGHHEQEEGKGIMGGKTSDRRTIPLCPKCHMLRHEKGREVYGSMDVGMVIAAINEAYDERRK